MQGGRPPQPSGTNRPSSSACPSHGRSRGTRRLRALCGPQGTAAPPRRQNAPRRPAAMAGEAHPVPSRTRKLSPRAPIVLRVEPVGDQDAAGRLGAFSPREGPRAERGAPPFLRGRSRPAFKRRAFLCSESTTCSLLAGCCHNLFAVYPVRVLYMA